MALSTLSSLREKITKIMNEKVELENQVSKLNDEIKSLKKADSKKNTKDPEDAPDA